MKKDEVFEYSFKIELRKSFNYKSKKLEEGPFNKKAKYYYVRVTLKSKNQEIEQTFKWKASKKKKTIKGKIPVYAGMQTGTWQLHSVQIFDYNPDNRDDIYGSILYITDGTKKQQKQDDSNGLARAVLSFADFKVKGKRKTDKEAPIIDEETLSISKNSVEIGEKVKFSVKVEDASKVQKVSCGWITTGEQNYKGYPRYDMKYNKETQCYECEVWLNLYETKATLESIYTKDIYGNTNRYDFYKQVYDSDTGYILRYEECPEMTIYKK